MWHVYLLHCKDDSIYTGITQDVDRRVQEHKTSQGGKYTKDSGVEKLLYTERFKTRSKAVSREDQIKGWRREKKLNLIRYGHPNGDR